MIRSSFNNFYRKPSIHFHQSKRWKVTKSPKDNKASTPDTQSSTRSSAQKVLANMEGTFYTNVQTLQNSLRKHEITERLIKRFESFGASRRGPVMDSNWWRWNIAIGLIPSILLIIFFEYHKPEMHAYFEAQREKERQRLLTMSGGLQPSAPISGTTMQSGIKDRVDRKVIDEFSSSKEGKGAASFSSINNVVTTGKHENGETLSLDQKIDLLKELLTEILNETKTSDTISDGRKSDLEAIAEDITTKMSSSPTFNDSSTTPKNLEKQQQHHSVNTREEAMGYLDDTRNNETEASFSIHDDDNDDVEDVSMRSKNYWKTTLSSLLFSLQIQPHPGDETS